MLILRRHYVIIKEIIKDCSINDNYGSIGRITLCLLKTACKGTVFECCLNFKGRY